MPTKKKEQRRDIFLTPEKRREFEEWLEEDRRRMDELWQGRDFSTWEEAERFADTYEDLTEEQINQIMSRLMSWLAEDSEAELRKLWVRIQEYWKGSEQPYISDVFRYQQLYDTLRDIAITASDAYDIVMPAITEAETALYNATEYAYCSAWGIKKTNRENEVRAIVKAVWTDDGLNQDQRYWRTIQGLIPALEKGLMDVLVRGASWDDMQERIMVEVGVAEDQAEAITRTECVHVANRAKLASFIDAGFTHYAWSAYREDKRTCAKCKALDGRIFPVTDREHLPPKHTNCRCAIRPVFM